MQNVMEALVEGWEGLIGDILDKRVTRWVFPFATTFFIFIVISNLTDLIPGRGQHRLGTPTNSFLPFAVEHVHRPFFRPPTTDANLTVAMAGIFLVMSLYWAVRYNGLWGLIKHIFGVKMETSKWLYPLFFLLFLFIGAMELLSIGFARPVALAMRLYGNIFAGETILDMTFHSQSFLASVAAFDVHLFLRNLRLPGAGVCVCDAGRGVCRHAVHAHGRGTRPLNFNLRRRRMPGRQPKPTERKVMMLAETTPLTGNVHIGLAFGGAAIGIGIATAGGVIAMSRNPGMFGKILTFMFVGMALAEGWAVIAWLVVK